MKSLLQFDPLKFRSLFNEATGELVLSLKSGQSDDAKTAQELVAATEQSIDIMERINADKTSTQYEPLTEKDISQIGDYVLSILDELAIVAANRGLQNAMMQLHRLSLPTAVWINQHGGQINKLDIVVNAVASFANEIKDQKQLGQLCRAVTQVVNAVSNEIRRDLEASNPMRPWRILNINWGIIATRSHDDKLMEEVFDQMVVNIPTDAKMFFHEGMQQMDIIGYPDNVRAVMEKYSRQWGLNESLH